MKEIPNSPHSTSPNVSASNQHGAQPYAAREQNQLSANGVESFIWISPFQGLEMLFASRSRLRPGLTIAAATGLS